MSIQRFVSNGFVAMLLALAGCIPPPPAAPTAPPNRGEASAAEGDGSDTDGDDGEAEGARDADNPDREINHSPNPTRRGSSQHASGRWSCRAEGSYETCSSAGLCTRWPVYGMGVGSSESQAKILAETNCSGHMTDMMATANLGDSSASVRVSCAASSCSP